VHRVSLTIAAALACVTACSDQSGPHEARAGATPMLSEAAGPTAAAYYVAPTGTSSGVGSADDPLDLSTALAGAGGRILPGDTIWLRGGTYSGAFRSDLNGTTDAPVVVRAYPGERATIDGEIRAYGSYTTFWGFEIAQADPAGMNLFGMDVRGPGHRLINLVVHDAGRTGIGFWMEAIDAEVYGCIVYNNGVHENLDHGIYAINRDGTKHITDNVVFNNLGYGIHVYGQASSGQAIRNIRIEGNAAFNNGSIATTYLAKPNFLVGSEGLAAEGIVVSENTGFFSDVDAEYNMRLGSDTTVTNWDLVAEGNYLHGGSPVLKMLDWTTVTLSGDSLSGTNRLVELIDRTRGDYQWDGNAYRYGGTSWAWTAANGAYKSFTAWKATTGFDASATAAAGLPSVARIAVRKNRYERGRAHIIVNNWALLSSVAVDVSSVLEVGDRYEVHSVQDLFGAPVTSGTYDGGAISIPMLAVSPPAPVGRAVRQPPVTGPAFDVFLLTRVGN
jgi:hypothetical protein